MQVQEDSFTLPVLGMTCAACVRRVEGAITAVPGVTAGDVNLVRSSARATVELDRSLEDTRRDVIAAIRKAGYEVPADALDTRPTGWSLKAVEEAEAVREASLRRDMVIAIVLTVPLLVLAMSHGRIPMAPLTMVIAQAVLGTAVLFGPGRRYVRLGVKAVMHRAPDMHTLIALGAFAAWFGSIDAVRMWWPHRAHHAPEMYFEAGAAIIAFVLVGKVLEARARSRLGDAVKGLTSLAPRSAWVVGEAGETRVLASELEVGAMVRVKPGERAPADGTVLEGTSSVDESLLTGEALPVEKEEGSALYAGTLNHTGMLLMRVARAGDATAVARIARAVDDAQTTKPPIARLADRIAARFVPAVLLIALVTFLGWRFLGDETRAFALTRAIAVLVIACPCALGLATPAAIAVGTARGAQLGVLFRTGEALERGASIDTVALDKTGTLTLGAARVTTILSATLSEDELLRLAASVEAGSEHPLARAIGEAAAARSLALSPATQIVATPGVGVTGVVGGTTVTIGTSARGAAAWADRLPAAGSVAYVTIDAQVVGAFAFTDPPAPAAAAAIEALRAMHITPVLVTGDREGPAREVAAAVKIDRVHASVSPTGKAALVRELRAQGACVAMVGDGLNDAPALAAADLGVAVGSGTDVAVAAADVTLVRAGVEKLPVALGLARATMRTIRRNLGAAFAYNVVCIPLAAGVLYPVTGWLLSPIVASAVMSLSSISVVLSSLRLRSYAA